jgi:predicted RNA-binding Zn-ribbon protein involved in translation (DUF1610 family)
VAQKTIAPSVHTLTIEPGVEVRAVNPSWRRPFKIVKREERDGIVAFLCKFTEMDPDRNPSFPNDPIFNYFRVAHHKASGITDAGCALTHLPDEVPGLDFDRAVGDLDRFKCPKCGEHVRLRSRVLKRRVELVVTQYTCPKCGHSEIDCLD